MRVRRRSPFCLASWECRSSAQASRRLSRVSGLSPFTNTGALGRARLQGRQGQGGQQARPGREGESSPGRGRPRPSAPHETCLTEIAFPNTGWLRQAIRHSAGSPRMSPPSRWQAARTSCRRSPPGCRPPAAPARCCCRPARPAGCQPSPPAHTCTQSGCPQAQQQYRGITLQYNIKLARGLQGPAGDSHKPAPALSLQAGWAQCVRHAARRTAPQPWPPHLRASALLPASCAPLSTPAAATAAAPSCLQTEQRRGQIPACWLA